MPSLTVCLNFTHTEWKPVYCAGVRKGALAEAEVRFNESHSLEYVQQYMLCFIVIISYWKQISFLLSHQQFLLTLPYISGFLYYDNYCSIFSLNLILVLCTSLNSKHVFTAQCQKCHSHILLCLSLFHCIIY